MYTFENFITKGSSIITAAPDNGSTSLLLYIANKLCVRNSILVYSKYLTFDLSFVKNNYKNLYNLGLYIKGNVNYLLDFIIERNINYILIDNADSLLYNKNIIDHLTELCYTFGIKIICTSQIRQDMNSSVYSTIENYSKNRITQNKPSFTWSIWVRNVTEINTIYNRKYIDIYDGYKVGNKYEKRFIANYNNNGRIINIS